ncbi:hypothetical protein [Spirosoma linguale]|uniref:Uncharacterized protein n=1 Tax=Spirosoma linguale (strain ATCC 33905 / DSM 74 / LMG 10896 / Claus 1) TaxID=504472 RepID=D2QC09_SPILD|nr:hypothetical protein Slin_3695 [Spirosoma linguale DSM 74]ADB39744.1 hypothetical protein Slin_3748 [Spirosoma linguale DSM 74]
MKKLAVSILISVLSHSVTAQLIVDTININKLDIEYIRLTGCDIFNGFSRQSAQASVWIDFGQGNDQRTNKEFLKPDQQTRFSSTVAALNYCYKNGWEVVQYESGPNSACHTFLLRRRNPSTK